MRRAIGHCRAIGLIYRLWTNRRPLGRKQDLVQRGIGKRLATFRQQRQSMSAISLSAAGLTTWQLTEELQRPLGSKQRVELKLAIFRSNVGLEHIGGFAKAMLKNATDSVLLPIFAWWNCQSVIGHSGGT